MKELPSSISIIIPPCSPLSTPWALNRVLPNNHILYPDEIITNWIVFWPISPQKLCTITTFCLTTPHRAHSNGTGIRPMPVITSPLCPLALSDEEIEKCFSVEVNITQCEPIFPVISWPTPPSMYIICMSHHWIWQGSFWFRIIQGFLVELQPMSCQWQCEWEYSGRWSIDQGNLTTDHPNRYLMQLVLKISKHSHE